MGERMIKVVYPNGFTTQYRKEVAEILLKKGAVETEAAYRKRIEGAIRAKVSRVAIDPVDPEDPEGLEDDLEDEEAE